ncbi:MAG: hypothetical protein MJZ26_09190 [Fibrobacter sp.]|nr:hypothetical protein [Fibrobacter sp.]
MFSDLREGSQVYILTKERIDAPKLEVGKVVSYTQPVPKYPNSFSYVNPQVECVMDLKVSVGDETFDIPQLPSREGLYRFKNVVVTDSRDAMNMEVEKMRQMSAEHVETTPLHEKALKAYDDILATINPSFAKDKRLDDMDRRINSLDEKLDKILDSLSTR